MSHALVYLFGYATHKHIIYVQHNRHKHTRRYAKGYAEQNKNKSEKIVAVNILVWHCTANTETNDDLVK